MNKIKKNFLDTKRLPIARVLSASVVISSIAHGAVTEENLVRSGLLEEVVITAKKRSESAQTVAVSVTAFSGDQMRNLGFNNSVDITEQSPSVSIYQFSPSVSNINIRGVSQNDFADHLEGPIAVYMDEGYIGSSSAANVPIFDLDRVEVLRGPQGTLFGRNSTGGLIHYVSAPPTEDLEGYLKFTAGNFNTVNAEGAISGPLKNNILGRLAFSKNFSDGPYDNPIGDEAGNTDNYALRGILVFDLSASTELRLLGKYYTNGDNERGPQYSFQAGVPDQANNLLGRALGDSEIGEFANLSGGPAITGECPGCNVVGYAESDDDPYTNSSNRPGDFERDIKGAQVHLTHGFESGVNLTSITDYLDIDKSLYYDVDGSAFHFMSYGTDMDYEQFSQELRLDGETDRLKWVMGAYYLKMEGSYQGHFAFDFAPFVGLESCQTASDTVGCGIGGTLPALLDTDYDLDSVSSSVFIEADYAINDSLSFTLGGRYTWEEKEYDFVHGSSGAVPIAPTVAFTDSEDYNNYALRTQLDYRLNDDVLLYASFSRGHKSGSFSAPIFPPIVPEPLPHDDEVLLSYELGFKSSFWDSQGIFNLSAFYYDYQDYQAFSFLGLSTFISNVDAEVYGMEFDFRLSPLEGLELSLGGAMLDGQAQDVNLANGATIDPDLPGTPDLELNGLIRYSWNIAETLVSAQASVNYVGSRFHTVQNEPSNFEPSYTVANARLSALFLDETLEIAGYVRNFTNEEYRVWSLDVTTLSTVMQVFAPPRTYGVSMTYDF